MTPEPPVPARRPPSPKSPSQRTILESRARAASKQSYIVFVRARAEATGRDDRRHCTSDSLLARLAVQQKHLTVRTRTGALVAAVPVVTRRVGRRGAVRITATTRRAAAVVVDGPVVVAARGRPVVAAGGRPLVRVARALVPPVRVTSAPVVVPVVVRGRRVGALTTAAVGGAAVAVGCVAARGRATRGREVVAGRSEVAAGSRRAGTSAASLRQAGSSVSRCSSLYQATRRQRRTFSTRMILPPSSVLLSPSMAASASSDVFMVTKPKPRDSRVCGSNMIWTLSICSPARSVKVGQHRKRARPIRKEGRDARHRTCQRRSRARARRPGRPGLRRVGCCRGCSGQRRSAPCRQTKAVRADARLICS
jgi:hypothetical protein